MASLSQSHTQLHPSGLYRQSHLLGLGRRALLPHAGYFYNRQLPDRLLSGSEQSAALQQQEPEEPLHQLPTQPSTGRSINMRPWPQITPATWDHRQGSLPGSGLGGGVGRACAGLGRLGLSGLCVGCPGRGGCGRDPRDGRAGAGGGQL